MKSGHLYRGDAINEWDHESHLTLAQLHEPALNCMSSTGDVDLTTEYALKTLYGMEPKTWRGPRVCSSTPATFDKKSLTKKSRPRPGIEDFRNRDPACGTRCRRSLRSATLKK